MPVVAHYSADRYDQDYFLDQAGVEARSLMFMRGAAEALEVHNRDCADVMNRLRSSRTSNPRLFAYDDGNSYSPRKHAYIASRPELASVLGTTEEERFRLEEFSKYFFNGEPPNVRYRVCDTCREVVWGMAVCYNCSGCRACEPKCDGCGGCKRCCRDCLICAGCTAMTRRACGVCRKCEDCCRCPKCRNCGVIPGRTVCSDCSRCTVCRCVCSTSESFHPPNPQGGPEKQAVWKDGDQRLAGLEVEYNNCANFKTIRKWAIKWGAAIHSDGSCGWECVSSPASGDKLTQQIDDLGIAMREAAATADARCGVHVHVDAKDLNLHAIRRLAIIYGKVEPILYLLGGQNRGKPGDTSHYCKPNGSRLLSGATHAQWHAQLIREIYINRADLKRMAKDKRSIGKKDRARYVGLNMCPWVAGRVHKKPDTTVEFRLHKNCLDKERLKEWAKILVGIVDFAKKSTYAEVMALPSDSARALCAIVPGSSKYIVKRIVAWRKKYKHSTPMNEDGRVVQYKMEKHLHATKPRRYFWFIPPGQSQSSY